MQKSYYDSTAHIMMEQNHKGHNSNPDYYDILLKEVVSDLEYWKNKTALDFGCGCGRNIKNLLERTSFERVDGCDISQENIVKSNEYLLGSGIQSDKFQLYTTTGTTLEPIPSDHYDFVMSTIVLQHICVHDIRFSLLKDIFRVLKNDGLFSFQMIQYDRSKTKAAHYNDNEWNATGTNGRYDISIDDPQDMINELKAIGFKNITYEIRPEWDANHEHYIHDNKWIFFKANK